MRRAGRIATLVLFVALLAAGCGPAEVDERPVNRPAPTALPYTGKWGKLRADCPFLTSETAASLGHRGFGRLAPGKMDTIVNQLAYCLWGQGEGSIGVVVSLECSDGPLPADQQAAKYFHQQFTKHTADGWILRSKPEPGLGDEAHLIIHRDAATVELWILSSNAQITVSYTGKNLEKSEYDAALARHRDALRGLAADVFDDLQKR